MALKFRDFHVSVGEVCHSIDANFSYDDVQPLTSPRKAAITVTTEPSGEPCKKCDSASNDNWETDPSTLQLKTVQVLMLSN